MAKELPSPELLRKLLRYEPDTGKLYWRVRTRDELDMAADYLQSWNRKNAGKEAFTTGAAGGQRRGWILDHNLLAQRVIWAMQYGKWPVGAIKHINGDKSDNRLANLRAMQDEDAMKLIGAYPTKQEAADAWARYESDLGCAIVADADGLFRVLVGIDPLGSRCRTTKNKVR